MYINLQVKFTVLPSSEPPLIIPGLKKCNYFYIYNRFQKNDRGLCSLKATAQLPA
jgi:hypothetical protein